METIRETNKREFLIENVLTKFSESTREKLVEDELSIIRKDTISKPIIYIGTGTCGLGAGAGETFSKAQSYLDNRNIDAEIIKVGCIGLCAAEPLLDIQLPGKTRISYQQVNADMVEQILDNIFTGSVENDNLLGQFRNEKLETWDNAPFIDEHPFFAPQKRVVLKNCGIVNPIDIDEYIARSGYSSFLKTIFRYSGTEVCEKIDKSGLAGRGGGGLYSLH